MFPEIKRDIKNLINILSNDYLFLWTFDFPEPYKVHKIEEFQERSKD